MQSLGSLSFQRSHPQTPVKIPRTLSKQFLFRNFSNLMGVNGEVWGPIFPGALWAKSLKNLVGPRQAQMEPATKPQETKPVSGAQILYHDGRFSTYGIRTKLQKKHIYIVRNIQIHNSHTTKKYYVFCIIYM